MVFEWQNKMGIFIRICHCLETKVWKLLPAKCKGAKACDPPPTPLSKKNWKRPFLCVCVTYPLEQGPSFLLPPPNLASGNIFFDHNYAGPAGPPTHDVYSVVGPLASLLPTGSLSTYTYIYMRQQLGMCSLTRLVWLREVQSSKPDFGKNKKQNKKMRGFFM